ncbi:MAG: preprotein translocase subunit SecE [candidate division WOR-3 bacterium]|nr:preprotein translocase subunit SecE [candidate division WOR-3 bacterium]MCX7837425.1 preprotein translocase subunit SecE [candidate division WOR-3 bacterium]MDW8114580.1 preprotein translocase subunit SecE [candidate division WOR-3 bacterium]
MKKILIKAKNFLIEVKNELKKVSWSSRRELFQTTLLVIILSFLLSLFIGFWDLVFSRILKLIIR